ncbi:unnamed protein product [Spodoptera exigua]|uniref:Las1-like protein n=1 Tax=Spodoptera exigua TaxID=7107 RepID=A0A922M9G4_SPOEX|nr:hypothetical protein HF086_005887 [Spodoptera exigua]CAH0687837.1 unnamed protein product [Spodoptera exigua]
MSDSYHVVPWFNSEEWHGVYDDLADPSSNKEKLLECLLVWKARCPSLPSGIESTLSLLQVYNEDNKNHDYESSDQLLRLAYSSAIMRFVNHMLDTETVKGASLYQAARTLGVPDWVVDLRHDTAHSNTLPPLKLLREGCLISLQWLQLNYWDKLKPYIKDYVCGQEYPVSGDIYKIETLLNFYISLGICIQTKIKMKNLSEIPNAKMRDTIVSNARELLRDQDLSNLKTVSINSLINILNIQGKKLLKVKEPSTLVTEILLGNESLLLSKELLYFFGANDFKYKNKLCSSYVRCFEILLTFLHTNDLLLDLIMGLVKVTQNQESGHFKSKLSALWLSEILAALKISQNIVKKTKKMSLDDKTSKKKNDIKKLYEHWYPGTSIKNRFLLDLQKSAPEELQDISYINPIITTYNNYLTYFINTLLDLLEPNLPRVVYQKICNLAKLISTPEKFPVTASSAIYTVDDLEANDDVMIVENVEEKECGKEEAVNRSSEHPKIINSIWKLAANEFDWMTCPIGKLPSQNKEKEMETN